MIIFNKPSKLNGTELVAELLAAGINVSGIPFDDGEGNLLLDIDESDESKARQVIAKHKGTTIPPEPTVDQKLEMVGLTINDLKAALGI